MEFAELSARDKKESKGGSMSSAQKKQIQRPGRFFLLKDLVELTFQLGLECGCVRRHGHRRDLHSGCGLVGEADVRAKEGVQGQLGLHQQQDAPPDHGDRERDHAVSLRPSSLGKSISISDLTVVLV